MPFGVYVHIPFCAARCDYCDFATWTDRAHLIDQYVDACVTDINRRRVSGELPSASSVFFGGGTPSLLAGDSLARILDAIPRDADAEVTVECNPDSVSLPQLATLATAGVNRCSFGVQSMVPHVLAALGRTHDPANVERAVTWARAAGINRISLDLIYGAPGESTADWSTTLERALVLEPEHVSAYALTIEPGTPMGREIAAGGRATPDDDDQADKYEIADTVLSAAGLEWYDISNWARPGAESRHNVVYWYGDDYGAIGCAAHGYTNGRRWWNVRTPERYIEAITEGRSPVGGDERLDPVARAGEAEALALRTRAGAALTPGNEEQARALAEMGLVTITDGRIVLTRRGRLLGNEVTLRLAVGRLDC